MVRHELEERVMVGAGRLGRWTGELTYVWLMFVR
jgi:hypothetical protein